MRANTANNNGIKIFMDITDRTLNDKYTVSFKVQYGTGNEIVMQNVSINALPGSYYILTLVRQANNVNIGLRLVDTLSTTNTLSTVTSATGTYPDLIDFSNMPLQLGNGGFNCLNLLAVSITQVAMTDKDIDDMSIYWRSCLLKTGPTAFALAQQALALSACPLGDSNVCESCNGIQDWRNINQLVIAPETCRKAFDEYCTTNSNVAGCECYNSVGLANQECTSLRNMMKGVSSCSLTEINDYVTTHNMCGSTPKDAKNTLRDYITSEEYVIPAIPEKELSFWSWLMGA